MRLIDADELKEELIKAKEENEKEHTVLIDNDFITLIHDAPTVDAVEVVRCKDCKWQQNSGDNGWCDMAIVGGDEMSCVDAKDNNYCSYGERKDK